MNLNGLHCQIARSYRDQPVTHNLDGGTATVSEWCELAPEQPDGFGVIKNIVCGYCRNKLRHGCIEECAPEGLYRNLEPMELGEWQRPPELAGMSELMRYAPVTRLALMYLVLHYVTSSDDINATSR